MIDRLPVRSTSFVVVMALCTLVRAVFLLETHALPEFTHPGLDALFHDHQARLFADLPAPLPADVIDPRVDDTAFTRPPGYPAFLSLVYRVVGDHATTTRIAISLAQQLASLALVALIYVVTLRRTRRRATATASSLIVGLAPSLVFFELELFAAAPSALLLSIFVLASWRSVRAPSSTLSLALGVLSGALVVTRPNFALPILLALLVVEVFVKTTSMRARAFRWAALVVGVGAVMAPVTLENARRGDPALVSRNGATTLLYGNNARADGVHMNLPVHDDFRGIDDVSPFTGREFQRAVAQNVGRPLTARDVDALLAAHALKFWTTHPLHALRLTLKKTALFFGPSVIGNNRDVNAAMRESRVVRVLPFSFPFLFALGFGGLFVSVRRRRENPRGFERAVITAVVVVGLAMSVIPFVAAERFRVPLTGVLVLLGFPLVDVVVVALKSRRRHWPRGTTAAHWPRGATAALAVFALVLCLPRVEPESAARFLYERARAEARKGDDRAATLTLEAALIRDPHDVKTLREKGFRHLAKNEAVPAGHAFDRTLAILPGDTEARLGRAAVHFLVEDSGRAAHALDEMLKERPDDVRLLELRARVALFDGDPALARTLAMRARAKALDNADVNTTLAAAVLQSGSAATALTVVDVALAIDDEHEEALLVRARALHALGRTDEAARAFARVAAVRPDDARAHQNLGALAFERRDFAAAERAWARAYELDPDDAFLATNRGRLFQAQGKHAAAAQELQRALMIIARKNRGPHVVIVKNMLAQSLIERQSPGDLGRALILAEEVVGRSGRAPVALETKARVLDALGRRDDAQRLRDERDLTCARTPDAEGCAAPAP